MGSSDLIIGLGVLGIGGYFFVTQILPSLQRQLSDMDYGGRGGRYDEQRDIPLTIIEDRYPDYIYEDRYPDYIIEDRYPDYIPPYPFPVITPSPCSAGKYWDGLRCKKRDCGPGLIWDDGRCRVDCPAGWRYKNGTCVPRSCDDNEYFDGRQCRDRPDRPPRDRDWMQKDRDIDIHRDGTRDYKDRNKPRIVNTRDVKCPPGYVNDQGKCKKLDNDREIRQGGNPRDRWHEDRDRDEDTKKVIDNMLRPNRPVGDETKRLEEIQAKAMRSFIDVDYLY